MQMNYDDKLRKIEETMDRLIALTGKSLALKDASATPTALFGQQPGGIFTTPGAKPDVINAAVMPQLGLISRLPVRGSTELYPFQEFITGFTAPSADKPTAICGPGPIPGNMKRSAMTLPFGRLMMSTRTVDLSATIGSVVNRGQFRDFRLVGDGAYDVKAGPAAPINVKNALNSEAQQQMLEFRVGWVQIHGKWLYRGDPANNTTDGGGNLLYGEPKGLDLLINTGYRDAITGQASPAIDPKILAFSANVTANPTKLVQQLTAMYRYYDKLANDTGLGPVKWALCGPKGAFDAICDVWPCAYNTYRCTIGSNGVDQRVQSVDQQIQMSQDMRNGSYLLIDGNKVEFIQDDAATETTADNATWTTSLYWVPLTYLGGSRPGLWTEYFDYTNQQHVEFRNLFSIQDKTTISDNGRFLWVRRQAGFCASMDAVERPRYVLEVPFLSGRVTGVSYTPLLADRSGWAGDARFYNGGVYKNLPGPSFFTAP